MQVLGIDIGGSFIKGAVVSIETGQIVSERLQVVTPQPATPEAVIESVCHLVALFNWGGVVGCGFPAVIQGGVAKTAANIDASWVGVHVQELLEKKSGCHCFVVNDADAAGLAEIQFGQGKGRVGTVLTLTLGTGIGSALFFQGRLIPNLELGFLPLNEGVAEHYAAAAVKTKEGLSWQLWTQRLNVFLAQVERLLCPELIILGGGISSEHEMFFPYLQAQAEITPARFFNQAGIVGAACFASS